MFCRKCGKEFEGKFCPDCGEPVEALPAYTQHDTPPIVSVSPTPKKKKGRGCLTIFIVLIVIGAIRSCLGDGNNDTNKISEVTVAVADNQSKNTSETVTVARNIESSAEETTVADNKDAALVADTELTKIITSAEANYNQFADLMAAGNASDLTLYDAAKTVKSNLGTYSANTNSVKCEGIEDYRNAANSYIINMQLIASDVMKYVDKKNMKDLSSAKSEMENNQNYVFAVISARMDFLKNSGYTDEEIMAIFETASESTAAAQ